MIVWSSGYLYQDTVFKRVKHYLSQEFNWQLQAHSAQLLLWQPWSNLHLALGKASLSPQSTQADHKIFELEQLTISIDPWKLWQGEIRIREMKLQKGRIYVETSNKNAQEALEQILQSTAIMAWQLLDIQLNLYHSPGELAQSLYIPQFYLRQALYSKSAVSWHVQGSFTSQGFESYMVPYFPQDTFLLEGATQYVLQNRAWHMPQITLDFRESHWQVQARYAFPTQDVSIRFEALPPFKKTLWAILPPVYHKPLSPLDINGALKAQGSLKGTLSHTESLRLSLDFRGEKLSIGSPFSIRQSIQDFDIAGSLRFLGLKADKHSYLTINTLRGSLANQKFRAQLSLQNLSHPYLRGKVEAGIDLAAFQQFYPLPAIQETNGLLGLDIEFWGAYRDILRADSLKRQAGLIGTVECIDAMLKTQGPQLQLQDLQAKLQLKPEHWQLLWLKAQTPMGALSTQADIFIHPTGFEEDMPEFQVQSSIHLPRLSLSPPPEGAFYFSQLPFILPSNWSWEAELRADKLEWASLASQNLHATLQGKGSLLEIQQLRTDAYQGKLRMSGFVQFRPNEPARWDGQIQIQEMQIGQFMQAAHFLPVYLRQPPLIRGLWNAQVQYGIRFDPQKHYPEGFMNIQNQIRQGNLHVDRFRQEFVQEAGLATEIKPGFDHLKLQLAIRDRHVFIPEMKLQEGSQAYSAFGFLYNHPKPEFELFLEKKGATGLPLERVILKGKPQEYRYWKQAPSPSKSDSAWKKEQNTLKKLYESLGQAEQSN